MEIYPIPNLFNSLIALAPCPLGNEKLADEIKSLQQQNYKLVISMLTDEEQEKHGLTAESEQCAIHGITYLNYPIRDEVADSDSATIEFVVKVVTHIKQLPNDDKILFHCRGGVGRSSMMIALVMANFGHDVDEVLAKVTHVRGEQAPESDEQLHWVRGLAEILGSNNEHKNDGG